MSNQLSISNDCIIAAKQKYQIDLDNFKKDQDGKEKEILQLQECIELT